MCICDLLRQAKGYFEWFAVTFDSGYLDVSAQERDGENQPCVVFGKSGNCHLRMYKP